MANDKYLNLDAEKELIGSENYCRIVARLVEDYARLTPAAPGIVLESILDVANDHYLLVEVGWRQNRRVYQSLIHLDIIDGKVWIQRNETDQPIARELMEAGIPRECIVLGLQRPDRRQFTDYAAA